MNVKPERRKLAFTSLAEVVVDAENLLAKGYDRAGNWDLAQVCGHLAEWLRFPVEGFPKFPLMARPPVRVGVADDAGQEDPREDSREWVPTR